MLFTPLPGKTLFHRMDERLLFFSFALLQLLLVIPSPFSVVSALGLLLIGAILVRVRVLPFVASIRRILVTLLLLGLLPPITAWYGEGAVLPAVVASSALIVRIVALLLSAHILLGVLEPTGIARVLHWVTRPFGAPGRTFSLVVVAFFAILPRIEELLLGLAEARRLRSPGIRGALRRLRYIATPLLREGIVEADALGEAFVSRGFLCQDERGALPFRRTRFEWFPPTVLLSFILLEVVLPSDWAASLDMLIRW